MLVSKMKKIAHKIINAFGYDINRIGYSNDDLGMHLMHVLKSRDIDCILDVGANIGQYGEFLREIGFEGYIISFEPVKEVFEILRNKSIGDSKWLCYNIALSDVSSSKEINVYSATQFSSFLDVNEYSKSIWHELNTADTEVVEVVRLDDIFNEIINRTFAQKIYLKLDTQGYDLNVFRGATNSLSYVKAMQSELALIPVYVGMHDPYLVLNEYHKFGFYISGLYPINRDKSLAIIEYDCVLVKRN